MQGTVNPSSYRLRWFESNCPQTFLEAFSLVFSFRSKAQKRSIIRILSGIAHQNFSLHQFYSISRFAFVLIDFSLTKLTSLPRTSHKHFKTVFFGLLHKKQPFYLIDQIDQSCFLNNIRTQFDHSFNSLEQYSSFLELYIAQKSFFLRINCGLMIIDIVHNHSESSSILINQGILNPLLYLNLAISYSILLLKLN